MIQKMLTFGIKNINVKNSLFKTNINQRTPFVCLTIILIIGLINCVNPPSQSINKKMFYTGNFYFDTTATYHNNSANSVLNWYYTTNFPPSLLGYNTFQFLTTDSISITPLNSKISFQVAFFNFNATSITFRLTTQMISNIQYISIRYVLLLYSPALQYTFLALQTYLVPLNITLPYGQSFFYINDYTGSQFAYNSSIQYSKYYVFTGFNITATSTNHSYDLMLTNFQIDSTQINLTIKNGGTQSIFINQLDILTIVYATDLYNQAGNLIVISGWFASSYNAYFPLSYTALNQSFNNNNILVGLSRFGITNQNSLNFQLIVITNNVYIQTNNSYEHFNFSVLYATSYYCSQDYPYLLQTSNSCFLNCPSIYFNNQTQLTCDACYLPCFTCQSLTQCLSCTTEYYYDGIDSCLSCIANCINCTNNSSCTVCKNETTYNSQSNTCQKKSDSSKLILIIQITVPIIGTLVIGIIVIWCSCRKQLCLFSKLNIIKNHIRINVQPQNIYNNLNQNIVNIKRIPAIQQDKSHNYINKEVQTKPIQSFTIRQESSFSSSNYQLKPVKLAKIQAQKLNLPTQQMHDYNAYKKKGIVGKLNNIFQITPASIHKILQESQQQSKQKYIQQQKIQQKDIIINYDQIKIKNQLISLPYQGKYQRQTILHNRSQLNQQIPSHSNQESLRKKRKKVEKTFYVQKDTNHKRPVIQSSSIINDSRIQQLNIIISKQIHIPPQRCQPIKKISLPGSSKKIQSN